MPPAHFQTMRLALFSVLRRRQLETADGADFGIHDILFSDDFRVRYVVAESGWLRLTHRPLVPREALVTYDPEKGRLLVRLSARELEAEPEEQERAEVPTELLEHLPLQMPTAPSSRPLPADLGKLREGEVVLHSAREVVGYAARARDGVVGVVDDLLLDVEPWKIKAIIIAYREANEARSASIGPEDIESICWIAAEVRLALGKDDLNRASYRALSA